MTRKSFLIFLPVLIILVVGGFLLFQRSYTKSSFNDVAHVGPINILDLNESDYESILMGKNDKVLLISNQENRQVSYDNKLVTSMALSPTKKQVAFLYQPNSQSSEELTLALLGGGNTIQEIYHTQFASWDITSNIHWLGNNNIIFLRHCGSSCQGLTLLNVQNGKIANATLSYMFSSNQPPYTQFKDWFGNEHKMENLVSKVSTETINDKFYLIFEMSNEAGETNEQKRFLFTGESLILES